MKKLLLTALACSAVILWQGCRKNETAQKSVAMNGNFSVKALGLDNQGDYANFQISNAQNGMYAEVAGLSLTTGATGDLAPWTNIAHQKWRITNVGPGLYTLMNLGTGKLTQAYDYNGHYVPIQVSANSSDAQQWVIIPADSGYKVISKTLGLALTGNGTGMITLAPFVSGNKSQIWGAKPISPDGYRDDQVVNFFHRVLPSQGSIAFDQGSSIPLSDGRVLWVTEDAFDGNEVTADGNLKCLYFEYHNSILIQPANHDWNPNNTPNMTIATSTMNQPRQICNVQPGTDTSWPGVGIEVGDTVYMYNAEISFANSTTTQVIYELAESPSTNNQWAVKRTLVHGVSDQTDIGWQAGFAKADDGYVYVFGIKGTFFNANNVYVARFATSNPQKYYFWNGTTWANDPTTAQAAVVATCQSNVAFSYTRGHFIMMQTDLGYFCDPNPHNIYLSTSASATGSFTKPMQVFTIEDMYRGHLNRYYTPMIHPEFDNGKNELLLTYSINFGSGCTGVGTDNCVNNEQPSINYQVKGVRVPYSMIGL
jgi:hypothetical protein